MSSPILVFGGGGGGGGCTPIGNTVYLDPSAPAGGDGSACAPFATWADAYAAVSGPLVPGDPWPTIIAAPAQYPDDWVVDNGPVIVEVRGTSSLVDTSVPAIRDIIVTIAPGEAGGIGVTSAGGLLTGNVSWTLGDLSSGLIAFSRCQINGTMTETAAPTANNRLRLDGSTVSGAVSAADSDLFVTDTSFSDPVLVGRIRQMERANFFDGLSYSDQFGMVYDSLFDVAPINVSGPGADPMVVDVATRARSVDLPAPQDYVVGGDGVATTGYAIVDDHKAGLNNLAGLAATMTDALPIANAAQAATRIAFLLPTLERPPSIHERPRLAGAAPPAPIQITRSGQYWIDASPWHGTVNIRRPAGFSGDMYVSIQAPLYVEGNAATPRIEITNEDQNGELVVVFDRLRGYRIEQGLANAGSSTLTARNSIFTTIIGDAISVWRFVQSTANEIDCAILVELRNSAVQTLTVASPPPTGAPPAPGALGPEPAIGGLFDSVVNVLDAGGAAVPCNGTFVGLSAGITLVGGTTLSPYDT